MSNVECLQLHKKLGIVACLLVLLGGCSGTLDTRYSAIRDISNAAPYPGGHPLGGGFVAGMTPAQACIYFLDHYRTRKNQLCSKVNKKSDFSNLTLVNGNIVSGPLNQDVDAIAFFFDENAGLKKVMAVSERQTYMFNRNRNERALANSM